MRHLTTCGRCGGTAEWRTGSGWVHVADTPRTAGHPVDPDDSHAAGPDREDREPCNACGHPEHDDADLCEEEVSTGLYGSDGVPVYEWCSCTGSVPCPHCHRPRRPGEDHGRAVRSGDADDDAELVCVGADRHALPPLPVTPDPWLDPSHPALVPPF